MYLAKKDHISRFAPYRKLLRDDNDNPVGVLPQAFEMRVEKNEKALSVNWLEYFGDNYSKNVVEMVKSFRVSRSNNVGRDSAFCIGKVGTLEKICAENMYPKVRVLYEKNKTTLNNESHCRIIHLPVNDLRIMQSLASNVFTEIVPNKSIP